MPPLIELRDVGLGFPPAPPVLVNCQLSIRAGERVALLGPSGAGKTSILRLIAGLTAPTAGKLLWQGQPFGPPPNPARDVGMAFQQPVLFPHLNVEENLAIGWRLRYNNAVSSRWEKREPTSLRPRLDQVAKLLELQPLLARWPANLSGGERQRVALGRILVSRPAVFLLDEPLACLDLPLAVRVLERLAECFTNWQATVVWITHRQKEAKSIASRELTLEAGRLTDT